jgi:hypothetical protein
MQGTEGESERGLFILDYLGRGGSTVLILLDLYKNDLALLPYI